MDKPQGIFFLYRTAAEQCISNCRISLIDFQLIFPKYSAFQENTSENMTKLWA